MIKNFNLIVFICFALTACQPKGSLTYRYPTPEQYDIKQVMVVIDYLNLRDDVGKLWDFDSYYHQKTLDQLLAQVNEQLQLAGYPAVEAYLLSSGLLIKNDFAVEHYFNEQLQPELLYPPYILAQQNINNEHIAQHQEFLGLMVKYMGPRRHIENDELTHRGMQMGYHFESMDLPADTGILYIHINQSAPGIIKQMGTVLLTGAIASQADYAYVGFDASSTKQSSAFLVHKGSGQILWKNHSTQWATDRPLSELLNLFPKKH